MVHSFRLLAAVLLLVLLITGCKGTELTSERATNQAAFPVDYTIVYLIHGDGDYLYHDTDGKAHQADQKVLNEAIQVSRQAKRGEVHIFHLRPESRVLGLFPRKDRRYIHYRSGAKVSDVRYSPESRGENLFTSEKDLYRQNVSHIGDENDNKNILLFFGHKIPVAGGEGYHRSNSSVRVNNHTFSQSIEGFLHTQDTKFDLTVLSTCQNGTPLMASLLIPVSENLLASPQNLHLSHIDTQALLQLETTPEISGEMLGRAVSDATYQRLSKSIYSTVTLSLYDLNKLESLLPKDRGFESFTTESGPKVDLADNIDCNDYSGFEAGKYSSAIQTWYKPAMFGSKQGKSQHSGWGCPVRKQTSSSSKN